MRPSLRPPSGGYFQGIDKLARVGDTVDHRHDGQFRAEVEEPRGLAKALEADACTPDRNVTPPAGPAEMASRSFGKGSLTMLEIDYDRVEPGSAEGLGHARITGSHPSRENLVTFGKAGNASATNRGAGYVPSGREKSEPKIVPPDIGYRLRSRARAGSDCRPGFPATARPSRSCMVMREPACSLTCAIGRRQNH